MLYLLLKVILIGIYENYYVHLLRLDFDNGLVGSCWAYEEARAGHFQDFLFCWSGEWSKSILASASARVSTVMYHARNYWFL